MLGPVHVGRDAAGFDESADSAFQVHDADSVTAAFEDVHVPLRIHGHGARVLQRALGGGSAIGRNSVGSVARDRGDDARLQGDHADPAIGQVGYVELVAGGPQRDTVHAVEG